MHSKEALEERWAAWLPEECNKKSHRYAIATKNPAYNKPDGKRRATTSKTK